MAWIGLPKRTSGWRQGIRAEEYPAICVPRLGSGNFEVQPGRVPRLESVSRGQPHFNFDCLELGQWWLFLLCNWLRSLG